MDYSDILYALQQGRLSIEDAEEQLKNLKRGNKQNQTSEACELMNILKDTADKKSEPLPFHIGKLKPDQLGNPIFQERYNCKWNYYAGSMYSGV
ncbi:hypothetical protein, partial [Paenibacillus sp. GbtcB18]|uniref:hypothetical protein n=1 Tax=Paenibacillus sp. GbtcB18 TaxID=2824763 RepID=UPI001C2F1023